MRSIREFEPRFDERLAQSQAVRDLMHARLQKAQMHPIDSSASTTPSFLRQLPKPARRTLRTLATVWTLTATACTGSQTAPREGERTTPSIEMPSSTSGEWVLPLLGRSRYTQGPHNSGLDPKGVRDAIDIAPERPIACEEKEAPPVVAPVGGKVITVGNERNSNDPNHSIVEIDTGKEIVGVMHLDEMQVSAGDPVEAGKTPLGKVSCKHPPKGKVEGGKHAHMNLKDKNGKRIPIAGHKISGYVVKAGNAPGEGTMKKEGEAVITAKSGACGPDEASIRQCGGIRNDLQSSATAPVAIRQPVPQQGEQAIAPTSTARVQEAQRTEPLPPGWNRFETPQFQIDVPTGWFINDKRTRPAMQFILHVIGTDPPNTDPPINITVESYPMDQWGSVKNYANQLTLRTQPRWGGSMERSSEPFGDSQAEVLIFGDPTRQQGLIAILSSKDNRVIWEVGLGRAQSTIGQQIVRSFRVKT